MINQESFQQNGCVLIKNFIDTKTISMVSQYLENKILRREWQPFKDSEEVVTRFAYYADPLIEILLLENKSAVEQITNKQLIPTYSYARIYQPGEQLLPHLDRPSCEISVTVNVASKGPPSPIFMQYKNNAPEQHILNQGDAVVYLGCEVNHWRDQLQEDQLNVQFMLHYVDQNGPNVKYAKDQRLSYGRELNVRSQ